MSDQRSVSKTLGAVVDRFVRDVEALGATVSSAMASVSASLRVANDRFEIFAEKYGAKIAADEETEPDGYRFDLRYMPEAMRLTRQVIRVARGSELVPISFAVSLSSAFDAFLGEFLSAVFSARPALLGDSERPLTLNQLQALGTVDAAVLYIAGKEIETMIRKSRREQFKWLENRFDLSLRTGLDSWPTFVELTERRHCFVHNGGRVSEQYLAVCKDNGVILPDGIKSGDRLAVSSDYFEEGCRCTAEIGVKLGQVLWRKLFPADLKNADDALIDITYDLISEKRWKLALLLLDFASALPRYSSEKSRRMFLVNRGQAYKWSGEPEKCEEILNAEDWTACGDDFQLVIAVLRDRFGEAAEIMRRLGPKGLPELAYEDWPVFREFRKTKEFADTFRDLLGRSYEDVGGVIRAEEATRAREILEGLRKAGLFPSEADEEGDDET